MRHCVLQLNRGRLFDIGSIELNSILGFKVLALNLLNVHRTEHKLKKNVIAKVDRTMYEANVCELCCDEGEVYII